MNNEDKILELLTAMQARQEKSEELLGVMQASMQSMQVRQEKSEELLIAMQADMKGMHEKIDVLTEGQEELRKGQDELREDLDELRTSVNALLDWSERVSSIEQLRIPKIG